jgi:hypothetical protein
VLNDRTNQGQHAGGDEAAAEIVDFAYLEPEPDKRMRCADPPSVRRFRAAQLARAGARPRAVADRVLLFENLGTSIPVPFLVVLVFWLCIIFAIFGLFAPRNATRIAVLCVCALSVSGAIFLVLELDRSFERLLQVSGAPRSCRFDTARADGRLRRNLAEPAVPGLTSLTRRAKNDGLGRGHFIAKLVRIDRHRLRMRRL